MSMGSTFRYVAATFGVAVLLAFWPAGQASAAVVMASDFGENDCSGFFGSGFGSCTIFANNDTGERIELSPVIGKYNSNLQIQETNPLYPTFDGSEVEFSNLVDNGSDTNVSGTWTYTPGTDDPGARFWVAKSSSDFKLFWQVPDSAIGAGGPCVDGGTGQTNYTLACLQEAQVVTTGDWTTIAGKELSHLTLYDTEGPSLVPIPGAAWLFGSALLGLIGFSRIRRRRLATA